MTKPFFVIIAGTRGFSNYELLSDVCNHYLSAKISDGIEVCIVSGTARGADQLGEDYACNNNLARIRYPADWDKYGKSAGYRRNEEMAENADALIAFWDGRSKGTLHMMRLAKKRGLRVVVIRYDFPQSEGLVYIDDD